LFTSLLAALLAAVGSIGTIAPTVASAATTPIAAFPTA
jgi:hypothetical protein